MIGDGGPKVAITPRDLQPIQARLQAEVAQQNQVTATLEADIGASMDQVGADHLWSKAIKASWGKERELTKLVEQHAPERASELKQQWEHNAALATAVKSLQGLSRRLSIANDREGEVTLSGLAGAQVRARQSMLQDLATVDRALKAAEGGAAQVSREPLTELRALLERQIRRLEREEQVALPLATAAELADPQASGARIGLLLGDPALGQALAAKAQQTPGAPALLGAFALLADQASTAPDYARTGTGWHHPDSRVGYRNRAFEPDVVYTSEQRIQGTRQQLKALAQGSLAAADFGLALEQALIPEFLRQIGVSAEVSAEWKPTAQGIELALAHELLLPLRALNESIGAMERQHGHREEFTEAVHSLTRAVVEGRYDAWRAGNPNSTHQLAILDEAQKAAWNTHQVSIVRANARGGQLKTKEETGLDVFWVTKIGGPSHGFDYGPHCLMPLLCNARTRPIVVEDSSYPHHPVARSYLRLVATPNGAPVLYLEPLERDFIHRRIAADASTEMQAVIVEHALAKAQALGVPLSVRPDLRPFLDALGREYRTDKEGRYVLGPSAGVVEASDTLGPGHDWVQTEAQEVVAHHYEHHSTRLMIDPEVR